MSGIKGMEAHKALEKLKAGNAAYMRAEFNSGDISAKTREKTYKEGQKPYAVIISCSDSRVIPESIFMAGIGELFVIRVAGNVMDKQQLGSVEYALTHLGCNLVVVLGHTRCGAVDAAINNATEGYVGFITEEIRRAIGGEKDDYRACLKNAEHSARIIRENLDAKVTVVSAVYHIDSGRVEFKED